MTHYVIFGIQMFLYYLPSHLYVFNLNRSDRWLSGYVGASKRAVTQGLILKLETRSPPLSWSSKHHNTYIHKYIHAYIHHVYFNTVVSIS